MTKFILLTITLFLFSLTILSQEQVWQETAPGVWLLKKYR